MKDKLFLITFFLTLSLSKVAAQDKESKHIKSAATLQYAGSVGLFSIGYSLVTKRNKLEFGLIYGNLPKAYGGRIQTLSLKGTYNPFQLKVRRRFLIEPIQTGIFLCQNFGKNLEFNWGSQYPKGYYWWNRSLRWHVFFSTQISYKINKKIEKISYYLETNTNDLYIYSYVPNTKTMNWYDIFFLGMGIKAYIK